MRFFNLDLHISVIADVRNILEAQGHEVFSWSLSGHTWVFGKEHDNVEIITPHNWKDLDDNMINKFCDKYGEFLSTIDCFIVAFPICFAMIFERFNKPIIAVNCVRYDHPLCKPSKRGMLYMLHECLKRLHQKKLLCVVSNNCADLDYFRLGNPTIESRYIPSICLYTGFHYPKNGNKFLVYQESNENVIPNHPLIVKRSQLGQFKWDALMQFRGIIHVPYEATTMSIFEQVSSKIPMFFPSKTYMKYLCESKVAHFQSDYWRVLENTDTPEYLKETRSFNFWIDRADFYTLKGYYYYDSIPHLMQMITEFSDDTLYDIRSEFVDIRIASTRELWKNVIAEISMV
jgi:hypothetical protein